MSNFFSNRSAKMCIRDRPKPKDIEVALQALADLQLQHLAGQDFASLSGGQRQLILIARAIASECRLMLLEDVYKRQHRRNNHGNSY